MFAYFTSVCSRYASPKNLAKGPNREEIVDALQEIAHSSGMSGHDAGPLVVAAFGQLALGDPAVAEAGLRGIALNANIFKSLWQCDAYKGKCVIHDCQYFVAMFNWCPTM